MAIQQLITKLSVQGAGQYQQQLRSAQQATDSFARNASASMQKASRSMSALVGGFSGGGLIAGVGAVAGGGVIGKIAVDAFKAATSFEEMRMTLIALTGSAAEADAKLKFVDKLAIPALNTTKELQQAALQLEAMGVRAEAALPFVAKLGAAFKFDPDALRKAVSLFGRLKAGDMPDIELMAGLGLNKSQFVQKGVKFDGQGKLLSSAKETMTALGQIIDSKYGNILNLMANTSSAKLATLQDNWDRTMRKVGTKIQELVLPWIEKFSNYLSELNASGGIESMMDKFIKGFEKLLSLTLLWGGALLLIKGILQKDIFTGIAGLVMIGAGLAVRQHMQESADRAAAAAAVGGIAGAKFFGGSGGGTGAGLVPTDPNPELGFGKFPATQTVNSDRAKMLKLLASISDHTKPLVDFSKDIFGGGELGRLGVTPVELAGFRGAGGNQVVINVNGGNTDQIVQTVLQLRRQRLL